MKRVLSLILALLMSVTTFAFVSSAAAPADAVAYEVYFAKAVDMGRWTEIAVDETITDLKKDDVVFVAVNITQNPGITGMGIRVVTQPGIFEAMELEPFNFKTMTGDLISDVAPEVEVGMNMFNTAKLTSDGYVNNAATNATEITTTGYWFTLKMKVITDEYKEASFVVEPIADIQHATVAGPVPVYCEPLTFEINVDQKPAGCEHTGTTATYTQIADDDVKHTVTVTCDNPECQEVISSDTEDHAWGTPDVDAPSCNEEGSTTSTCGLCDYVKVETIPATEEHSEVIEYKPATVDEAGYIKITCSECETEISNTSIDQKDVVAVEDQTANGFVAIDNGTSADVKIVAGINTLNAQEVGFIITGHTDRATADLETAKGNTAKFIVAPVTSAFGFYNGQTAEEAFDAGYAIALKLTGIANEFAENELYVRAYVKAWGTGEVTYINLGSFTVADLLA